MSNLGKVAIAATTLVSAAVLSVGVGYVLIDIAPGVKNAIASLSNNDISNLAFISGLGAVAILVAKNIGKPFDALMDKMYPDDIKPKSVNS